MLPVSKNPPSLWPENNSIDLISGEWKVLHLKPRQEKAMARDLIDAGIAYCCPFYTNITRRKDNNKPRKSVLPVFSGYLAFAEKEGADSFIWKTNRAMRILKVTDQKKIIKELSWVLTACSQNLSLYNINSHSIKKGQPVRIVSGPMKGFSGEVLEVSGKLHVIISVEMFKQSIAVQVEASQLN